MELSQIEKSKIFQWKLCACGPKFADFDESHGYQCEERISTHGLFGMPHSGILEVIMKNCLQTLTRDELH
jgi:hypothetical protein